MLSTWVTSNYCCIHIIEINRHSWQPSPCFINQLCVTCSEGHPSAIYPLNNEVTFVLQMVFYFLMPAPIKTFLLKEGAITCPFSQRSVYQWPAALALMCLRCLWVDFRMQYQQVFGEVASASLYLASSSADNSVLFCRFFVFLKLYLCWICHLISRAKCSLIYLWHHIAQLAKYATGHALVI